MEPLDWTKLLNLCKLGRNGLLEQFPHLKKYCDKSERTPRWSNSDLTEIIRSRGDELKEIYQSLPQNPELVLKIYEFSDVLREKYLIAFEQANRAKYPREQQRQLINLFGEIKQSLIQTLGLTDAKSQVRTIEEILDMAANLGQHYFGD